jgi:hypothetical protein
MGGDFREWQPDVWFDRGFLQLVPGASLAAFLREVRPLTEELTAQVKNALFAGINLDNMLVCHPHARQVVLFGEEQGPIFGKRGPRRLPCPCW